MEAIKKIGHNIELKGFVIHKILKDAKSKDATLKLASATLTISDKETVFIAKVIDSYYKNTKRTYGIFEEEVNNKFKEALIEFNDQSLDFFPFSKRSMDFYKQIITTSAPATGGFVVFAYYKNTDRNQFFMLVLTLNNKDGYSFNEVTLTVDNIKNLELNKIDVACLINISAWNEIIDDTTETDSRTYLSFVRGNKEISYYFMTFIGCENKTTSTASSKKLATALHDYWKLKNYGKEIEYQLRDKVFTYCNECIKNKKEISLSYVSSIIDIEHPTDFQEFASGEDYQVNEIISGDLKIFRGLKFVNFKSDDLSIEFSKDLVGVNKQIQYDEQANKLTISNIPDDLKYLILN